MRIKKGEKGTTIFKEITGFKSIWSCGCGTIAQLVRAQPW